VSSPSIYTDTRSRTNIKEEDPLTEINLNHYITTKILAEKLTDEYAGQGLPIVTLRPQGIIGAGDPSIFPRILRSAKRGTLPKIGKGRTQLDLTYVDNVVHGLICAAQSDACCLGQKYNITNGEPVELYATIQWLLDELKIDFKWKPLSTKKALFLATLMENIYGLLSTRFEPPLTRYTVCTFAYDRTLDISKAKSELRYEPQVPVKQALNHVLQYFREDAHG
jgi:nucleoside-diphosphate-sugar epimerase